MGHVRSLYFSTFRALARGISGTAERLREESAAPPSACARNQQYRRALARGISGTAERLREEIAGIPRSPAPMVAPIKTVELLRQAVIRGVFELAKAIERAACP